MKNNNFKNKDGKTKGWILTSSYDWSVKLWNLDQSLEGMTFESAEDYVFDV